MSLSEIEKQLATLKAKQADYFKQSKSKRNLKELEAVREQMNALKKQLAELVKK